MSRPGVFRPNLRHEVQTTRNEPEKRQRLVRLVRELDGTGIIYASSVKQVDLLHALLNEVGFMAARDHRRMPPRLRKAEMDRFAGNRVQALVATGAIGARIDKPDARFTIHYALPGSLDAYYTESTRAGLDGVPARCVLLYDPESARAADPFVSGHFPDATVVTVVYSTLEQLGAHSHNVLRTELAVALDTVSNEQARDAIAVLKALDVLSEERGLKLRLRRTDLDVVAMESLLARHARDQEPADAVRRELLAYAETDDCRWRTLLRHFGEEADWERCGNCDNCLRAGEGPVDQAADPGDLRPRPTPAP
jgi:ATP-dependent DNA helicase RecQ